MKIVHESDTKEVHIPVLAQLKIGATFMFVDFDLNTGPFLVIDPKGYYESKLYLQRPKRFVLNLASNKISHRTVDAKIRVVNCVVTVGA